MELGPGQSSKHGWSVVPANGKDVGTLTIQNLQHAREGLEGVRPSPPQRLGKRVILG